MDNDQLYTIILRHDTSTQWMIVDPTLALGEYGVEDDTHRVKRGDGIHTWSELLYETFGLEYLISFKNLQGEVEDNEKLKEAFENVLTKEDFAGEDGKILLDVSITGEDGIISKFTKTVQDIDTGKDKDVVMVNVISSDNSVNGLWYTDKKGIETLDLQVKSTIGDFNELIPYDEDSICFYNNTLYRAKSDIQPGTFNESDWSILGTTVSQNLEFDNTSTSLKSTTVQEAIEELNGRVDDITDTNDLLII